jgi:hypothetical protein
MYNLPVRELDSDKSTTACNKRKNARNNSEIEMEGQVLGNNAANDDNEFHFGMRSLFDWHGGVRK